MSYWRGSLAACAAFTLLTACQTAPQTQAQTQTQTSPAQTENHANAAVAEMAVTGRISLSTEPLPGQSAQAFMAPFRLQGSSVQGQIDLQTPTGSLLAVLRWQPGSATLSQAGQADTHYADLPALLRVVMGPAAPEPALLFAWLQGQNGSHPDWQVDFSQYASARRIVAQRLQPLPRAQVRIKLDHTP